MAVLFTDQTTDAKSAGVAPGGPCTVHTSGVFDGCHVTIQVAPTDLDANYELPTGTNLQDFRIGGVVKCEAVAGYFVRVVLSNAGASTSVSAWTTP